MPFTGDIFPLEKIQKHTEELLQKVKQQPIQTGTEHFIPLQQLEKALKQFFSISEQVESKPELLTQDDSEFGNISELGDYGLQLLAGLEQWVDIAEIETNNDLPISTLSLAVWIHDHQGVLQQLENIVNALSQTANHTNDPDALINLHKIAEKTTNSCHEMIKEDIDKSEPERPWRILNLNHGIIATRSHNTEVMNAVFEQLLLRLPDDATNFFADGMKQMDIIGYPAHVKNVMEKFYKLTNQPTLH